MKSRTVTGFLLALPIIAAAQVAPENYLLGPDDQIVVRVMDIEETTDKPIRLDLRGDVDLPFVGAVHAGGLDARQLKQLLTEKYSRFVRNPQVSVAVAEFRSQPVSVLGEVAKPGVHQLEGNKSLYEVLSLAGGLKPEAGYSVKITRRKEWGPLPLPRSILDSTGNFSVGTVDIRSILEATHPEANILIKPDDVISVPRARLVYVTGAVRKAGGFVMGDQEKISVLKVMALAEGLDRYATPQNAHIVRQGENGREDVQLDLKKILDGKQKDVEMRPEDILFIPTSGTKGAVVRTLEAAIQMGTGVAIYRIP
jgi:polysaccharide biosynthesis/export protein